MLKIKKYFIYFKDKVKNSQVDFIESIPYCIGKNHSNLFVYFMNKLSKFFNFNIINNLLHIFSRNWAILKNKNIIN
jgi:hypothetical protein